MIEPTYDLGELLKLPDDAVVDSKAATLITGLPDRKLDRLRKERAIPYISLGYKTVRFKMRDLRAFVESKTIPARAA